MPFGESPIIIKTMSIERIYTDELAKNFGYYATWMPGVPIRLGQIGTLDKNVFTPVSSLDNFKIRFGIMRDRTKNDFKYSSEGAVTITQKLKGEAAKGTKLGEADAGIIIEFNKSNAIYFRAVGSSNHYIADKINLGRTILELYKKGEWKKEWVIITQIVDADSATILISKEKGAKLEVKAKADLKPAELDITNVDLASGIEYSNALSFKIVAKAGINPLFKVMGIKDGWLSDASFNSRSEEGEKEIEKVHFADMEVNI